MTPDLAELKRIAKKAEPLLANCEGRLNHPLRNRDGKRVVGFVLPESIAGLSDGLVMAKAVQQLAEAVPALIARINALEAGTRAIFDVAQGMNPDQSFNAEGRLRRCAEHAANLLGDRHG